MRSSMTSMIALAVAMIPQTSRADVSPIPRDVISLQQPTSCQAEAAPNSDIVVLSTSGQAGAVVPYAIDDRAVSHLIPVSGGKGRDVTLVLGSQSSVVWDLRGIASGRVKAIYVSGAGAQGVIGAPPTTKVEFADDQSGYGGGSCRFTVMAVSADGAVAAAVSVQSKFGRYPDRLFGGRAASAFDLDKVKAEVPKTADVKLVDIRASRTLSPDTPAPAPLLLKRMIEDGSIRIMNSAVMSQIRNAGLEVTPMQTQAPPESGSSTSDLLNRPGLTPEMRAAIMQSIAAREQARAQQMARMASYVPSSGIIVLKPIRSIPQMPGGDGAGAVFVPSDVTPPTQIGTRLYRLPMKASEVPESTRDGSSSSLTRMMEAQPGTQPEVAATWKGDSMTIRMPEVDQSRERRSISSAPIVEEEGSSKGLIALLALALLACIGGIGFLVLKGRRTKRPSTTGSASIGNAGDDDVLRQIHAVERTTTDPALKDRAAQFHAEVNRLAVRQDLDDDIAEKCGVLVEERFHAAAKRYLVSRPTADATTGTQMDEAMGATIASITTSLREMGAEQDRRNIDAMTMSDPTAAQDPGKPS